MRSPWQVLGIPEDASLEEASRAYRRLALAHHPDRFVGRPEHEVAAAQAAFVEAQLAYEEVQAILRGAPTSRARRSKEPSRSAPPPGPTAAEVIEREVAATMEADGWMRTTTGFPTSFLARRVARGATGSLSEVGQFRVAPATPADRAAMALAAFVLRPPRDELFDPTMVEFCTAVATVAIFRMRARLSGPVATVLWADLPALTDTVPWLGIPRFCNVCLVAPASRVVLRVVIGTLFWHRWQHLEVQRCAACAEPLYRDVQSALLRSGWWGPTSAVLTPIVLWRNHQAWAAARAATGPSRPRELPVAPATRPIASRWASWLSPALALLCLVWVLSRFWAGPSAGPRPGSARTPATMTKATKATGSTTAPPAAPVRRSSGGPPRLGATDRRFVVPGGPSSPLLVGYGHMVDSAGGRVPRYATITSSAGAVDAFVVNLPTGTTQAEAIATVLAILPSDATTTYLRLIQTYDNARELLVGSCVAWDLSSRSMARAFARVGLHDQRVIAVTLNSSKAANRGAVAGRSTMPTLPVLAPADADYDPNDVTSAQIFTMAPPKPTNQCWVPPDPMP